MIKPTTIRIPENIKNKIDQVASKQDVESSLVIRFALQGAFDLCKKISKDPSILPSKLHSPEILFLSASLKD